MSKTGEMVMLQRLRRMWELTDQLSELVDEGFWRSDDEDSRFRAAVRNLRSVIAVTTSALEKEVRAELNSFVDSASCTGTARRRDGTTPR